ncbi:MAG TPA: hypothetical protein VGK90_12940 [Rhizomicrobium sp.]|jgi:hypothetical protein
MKRSLLSGTTASICVAAACIFAPAAWPETASSAPDLQQAAAAAESFYAVYSTFHPSDGIPDSKARAKYEPFISPSLDTLLIAGAAAESHFAAVTKNMSPPLIEGDLFTSNFEGSTSHHVGVCNADANGARCAVSFSYRDGSRNAKPIDWTDTVFLVHVSAGWRVDDIAYGGSWDFGNKGRLKETLQSAIRDGNEAAQ